MDIKDGLKILQFHSQTAKYILTDTISILNNLDKMDAERPTNKADEEDLIRRKDDELVKLYNRLQSFHDYQGQFIDELCSTGLETALTSKLLENDTDPDEVIRRSGEVYADIFQECYYPNVWEESDFMAQTQSLKTDLKDRIVSRLMRDDELPDFKERMVGSGYNDDFISDEVMTLPRAERKASDWVCWLDLYLHNVCRVQKKVADILEEAYLIMNPQAVRKQYQQSPVLENDELKPIFEAAVQKGWMERQDYGFKWLRSNPLLAYFVRVLSIYLDLSKKLYEDADSVNWSYFSGVFKTKRQGGKWEYADATKLHDYMYGNMRGKTKFEPKGFNEIEDLMTDFR